jgi:hypothetical protein
MANGSTTHGLEQRQQVNAATPVTADGCAINIYGLATNSLSPHH